MDHNGSIKKVRRLAWAAVAACIGCCAIPVVALGMGFTTIAGLGFYFEQAALGFSIAAILLFLYLAYRKYRSYCDIDCSCKGETADKR